MFIFIYFSSAKLQVSWRPVFWGLGFQFAIGLFVIRTEPGLIAFKWLGDQVQVLLTNMINKKSSVLSLVLD